MAYLYKATAEPMQPVGSEAVCVFYSPEFLNDEEAIEQAKEHMAGLDVREVTFVGYAELATEYEDGIICRELGNY